MVSKPLAGDSDSSNDDGTAIGPLEKDISERIASGAPCQHLIDPKLPFCIWECLKIVVPET